MYKALIFKEWRELWWTGAIALAVLGCVVFDEVGLVVDLEQLAVVRRHTGRIPFRSDDMQMAVTSVACCLAVVLGLWQTLGESVRGTWRYLRQRPISFSRLLLLKLAAGLGLLLFSTGLPLALYLIWAVSDGLHSSPFEWEMAVPTFIGWTAATTVYLTAFLVGIREARWYGSRLWPVAPVVCLYLYFEQFRMSSFSGGCVICASLFATLGGILYSAGERDD